jgi:uncharacterized protein YbjT (DUF2867 family)
MNTSVALVTGGTGTLGGRVAERLRVAGGDVRILSHGRRPGVIKGDLRTGEGLDEAVEGVETIVHCASSPLRTTHEVDVQGTGRLLLAACKAGVSHFVYISIVGVDRNPRFPYYRAKLEAERTIEHSPVPWTILRATHFHQFVLKQIRLLELGPVVLVPKGFLLQPIDADEVADRLAELVLSGPAGRIPDVAGPEVRVLADLARSYLKVAGRRGKVVDLPVPGKVARAFRQGAHLVPDHGYGMVTWDEHLSRSLHPISGRESYEHST